jgi:hypothetical protein
MTLVVTGDRITAVRKTAEVGVPEGARVVDGKVLIVDSVIPSGNAAHFGKLLDLEMLALTPRGRERTQAEFRDLLKRSGFKLNRVIPTEIHLSLVEGART